MAHYQITHLTRNGHWTHTIISARSKAEALKEARARFDDVHGAKRVFLGNHILGYVLVAALAILFLLGLFTGHG